MSHATKHRRACVGAATTLIVLALATSSAARDMRNGTVDPGTRVNGMIVYQDIAQRAGAALFGLYCDPVVLTPGRRTRTCSATVPYVRRLFVGYGIWGPKRSMARLWNRRNWKMWIDGRPVALGEFGWTDRWLYNYPPAGYRNVLLREWSVMLTGARGSHSIRYRFALPDGVVDTTWRFVVART